MQGRENAGYFMNYFKSQMNILNVTLMLYSYFSYQYIFLSVKLKLTGYLQLTVIY